MEIWQEQVPGRRMVMQCQKRQEVREVVGTLMDKRKQVEVGNACEWL